MSDSTDVVIPATVSQNSSGEWIEGNTYTVTAIADGGSNTGVFEDSGITSVTFPSSLTSIGRFAFYRCSGLTGELNLGGCTSLTSIGDYAFYGCSGLTGELDFSNCTSLTSIGDFAFGYCSALESVVFPEGSTGWEVSTSPYMTNPISVDVTNPSTNASNLTGQYYDYYWKRNV